MGITKFVSQIFLGLRLAFTTANDPETKASIENLFDTYAGLKDVLTDIAQYGYSDASELFGHISSLHRMSKGKMAFFQSVSEIEIADLKINPEKNPNNRIAEIFLSHMKDMMNAYDKVPDDAKSLAANYFPDPVKVLTALQLSQFHENMRTIRIPVTDQRPS